MAKFKDLTDALDQVNEVTNTLAGNVDIVVRNEADQLAEIQRLKDQIAAGTPVTQEQLDAVTTNAQHTVETLTAVSEALKAIASNPSNPIPEVPPVEEPGNEGGTGTAGSEG